jgi:8-oxo-dGTP pyrophosphatase MutT (NUDIX family)
MLLLIWRKSDEGETPIQASKRELREETGINLDSAQFKGLFPDIENMREYLTYKVRDKTVLVFFLDDKAGVIRREFLNFNCTSLIDNHDPSLSHLQGT